MHRNYLYNLLLEQQGPTGTTAPTGTAGAEQEPAAPAGTPTDAMADPTAMAAGAPTPDATTPTDAGTTAASPTGETPGDDTSAETGEEGDESEESEEPTEKTIKDIEDAAKKGTETTRVLSIAKAGIQSYSDGEKKLDVDKLLQSMKDSGNVNVRDAANRLANYLDKNGDNKPMADDKTKKQLQETIKKLVKLKMRKLLESEGVDLGVMDGPSKKEVKVHSLEDQDAMQWIETEVQGVADKFIPTMRKQLNMADKLPSDEYKEYLDAVNMFRNAVKAAAIDAVNTMKHLSKKTEEGDGTKVSEQAAPAPAPAAAQQQPAAAPPAQQQPPTNRSPKAPR